MGTRFLYPWEKTYVIVCPECGGRIETEPLWFSEKRDDKLKELQRRFCHVIGSEFLEKIPVLTENDWKSHKRWENLWFDLWMYDLQKQQSEDQIGEKPQDIFAFENGLPRIFRKHGIFALIRFFNKTELDILFLLLGLEPGQYPFQVLFQRTMRISRSYVSTILKKLRRWRLVQVWKCGGASSVKGRARGRQLAYDLTDEARKILEQDLRNHDFFRNAVIETVRSAADRYPDHWKKDLAKTSE